MSSVAILMSTYNGEKYLDKQLESIAYQKCNSSISLYIRDDGSQDNTKKIIKKWEEKINIIFFEGNNKGPASSFWELFQNNNIKADYYAFCDQDDIWDTNKIDTAVSILKNNTHLYACNCRSIDANGNIIEEVRKKFSPSLEIETLFVSGILQGCSMVFTKALRDYICSQNITCVPMHDLIITMYAIHFGGFFWDHIPHFSYRFHTANVIANINKPTIRSIFHKVKKWKENKTFSMSTVAQEMLNNKVYISNEEKQFLYNVANYKLSIKNKYTLLSLKKIKDCEHNSLRSFYLKILLNRL